MPIKKSVALKNKAAAKKAESTKFKAPVPAKRPTKKTLVKKTAASKVGTPVPGKKPTAKKVRKRVAKARPRKITNEMRFLKRVHSEACQYFGTVLGPEANEAHRDHFHFDMAPRRRKNYCR